MFIRQCRRVNQYKEDTMNDFPEFDTTEQQLEEQIKHLDWINYQIAELLKDKHKSEQNLIQLLKHNINGQKKYNVGIYAVTVTTGFNYSLNKKNYESFGQELSKNLNPVKIKKAYYLDKKIINLCYEIGDLKDKNIMNELITSTPKKINITITAAK